MVFLLESSQANQISIPLHKYFIEIYLPCTIVLINNIFDEDLLKEVNKFQKEVLNKHNTQYSYYINFLKPIVDYIKNNEVVIFFIIRKTFLMNRLTRNMFISTMI